jgi:hypothetical protein
MKKEEFDALDKEIRTLVTEGYIDGFETAIMVVKSIAMRVGDKELDDNYKAAPDFAVSLLNNNLDMLKRDELIMLGRDELNMLKGGNDDKL